MDLNQFTQYFDSPKVSVFNRSKKTGFPMRIGPLYPTYWDICSFGNSHKGKSYHSMRLAPLLAPNFSDLRLQEHVAVIPLRVIMNDYEEVFNYATNTDGASLPHLTAEQYHKVLKCMTVVGLNPIGSLFDFLGYPVYGDLYKVMLAALNYFKYRDDNGNYHDLFYIPQSDDEFQFQDISGNIQYRNRTLSLDTYIYHGIKPFPFASYVTLRTLGMPLNTELSNFPDLYTRLGSPKTLDELIKASMFETVQSATDAYLNYLFGRFLEIFMLSLDFDETSPVYSTLPLRAYFRFHYDWNINGHFINRDVQLEDMVFDFENRLLFTADAAANAPSQSTFKLLQEMVLPVNRLWDNDFFTSLLPTSAVDNSIQIPANATVLDLAKLTALQKLALKLSYSSRYRDVIWNIFKIKPSDARLQQSSPIMQKTHNIGIGETLQTSESTTSSVQGNMAGRGYSSGTSKGYHIFCEEPCVVMQFASFVPRASYADAIHPLIHVDDILDFPIPDMDVLGNQPIYADLLSGNVEDSNIVLGYGRQYFDWLAQYNTVHGEFKTSLSYWQLTRRFTDTPALNDDFFRIDDHDDFDEIFSMPESMHAYVDFFYNCHASRHVHRNVRIQI